MKPALDFLYRVRMRVGDLNMRVWIAVASLGAAMSSTTAASASDLTFLSPDGGVSFSGSYGLTSLKANEFVWAGSTKVSQLKWKSSYVSTFNADLKVELPKDWYLSAHATVGFGGDDATPGGASSFVWEGSATFAFAAGFSLAKDFLTSSSVWLRSCSVDDSGRMSLIFWMSVVFHVGRCDPRSTI